VTQADKPTNPTWKQAAGWLGSELVQIGPSVEKLSFDPDLISTDSRSIKQQGVFVAIAGERFDGHDFITPELLSKVGGVVCSSAFYTRAKSERLKDKAIVVEDTLATYGKIASRWLEHLRSQTSIKVVAITGSVGKTTTKKMVSTALAGFLSKEALVSPPGSFNNEIGVPATILRCNEQTKCLVLEFGARNVGDISLLTGLTKPDIGVCLNAGNSHIGVFGSYANILHEKTQILAGGTKLGLCFADQKDLRELGATKSKNLRLFGSTTNSKQGFETDFGFEVAQPSSASKVQTHLKIHTTSGPTSDLKTSVVGPGIAPAICVAVAVVELLFPKHRKQALQALESANNESGRFEHRRVGKISFVNDAYNSNPQSLAAGLESLNSYYATQSKVLVLGTMLELGSNSAAMHAALAGSISSTKNLQMLVTIGEHANAFASSCSAEHQHFEDLEAFMQSSTWNSWVQSGTIEGSELVYLKASNTVGVHRIPELFEAAQASRT
jgi:UDP-N-acetylmuramoyl-tripeptide--D-alanyl-D-alanine ligase